MLDNVSYVEFSARSVPTVAMNRLNEHYSDVIALSQLILRHGSFESERGEIRASGFLMDMNVVFQEFVTTALREELKDTTGTLRSDKEFSGQRSLFLDEGRGIRLEPDLTWWRGGRCLFVGDAKYKNLADRSTPNADLYQLAGLCDGLGLCRVERLSTRKDKAEPRTYAVRLRWQAAVSGCPGHFTAA